MSKHWVSIIKKKIGGQTAKYKMHCIMAKVQKQQGSKIVEFLLLPFLHLLHATNIRPPRLVV